MKANYIKQEILDANPQEMAYSIQEYKYYLKNSSGSFMTSLIQTMSRADTQNFGKLSLAFPYLAEVIYSYKNIEGWHKENGFEN